MRNLRGKSCVLFGLRILEGVTSKNDSLIIRLILTISAKLVFEDACLEIRTLKHLIWNPWIWEAKWLK